MNWVRVLAMAMVAALTLLACSQGGGGGQKVDQAPVEVEAVAPQCPTYPEWGQDTEEMAYLRVQAGLIIKDGLYKRTSYVFHEMYPAMKDGLYFLDTRENGEQYYSKMWVRYSMANDAGRFESQALLNLNERESECSVSNLASSIKRINEILDKHE